MNTTGLSALGLALAVQLLCLGCCCGADLVKGNIAPRARVSVSSVRPEYPKEGANDGRMDTSWSVAFRASKDQWLQYDWDTAQEGCGVGFRQTGPYLASMDVEVLENGKWVKVAEVGGDQGAPKSRMMVPSVPRKTKSLRLANITATPNSGPAFYEVEVYSDKESMDQRISKMDVAVAGDARGNLIGTISTMDGADVVVGADIEVSGLGRSGPWKRTTRTTKNGFFMVDLPLGATGSIAVAVRNGSYSAALERDLSDISGRVTPRPPSGSANRLDLEGKWQFAVHPPSDWPSKLGMIRWSEIKVPAHWEMEGFTSRTGTGLYRKSVAIPAEWAGKRIKLRPDGIYCKCEMWLNGKRLGSHDGGATPFELDITDAVKPGLNNDLCVFVTARGEASRIDNMSFYAYFELAGIWRPIEVFAVESAHVSRLTYATEFDSGHRDADLTISLDVANEQSKDVKNAKLTLKLFDPRGKQVSLDGASSSLDLASWEVKTVNLKARVTAPEKWSSEQPRLYKLVAELTAGGTIRTIEQHVGFRQVEIKDGRRFTINGKLTRLWGTCMHEAHPMDGRAINAETVKQDLDLMKGANLNAIRTSHYPPHPYVPQYADQVGLYIEDEGPCCFVTSGIESDLQYAPLYAGIYSEFIERDRNCPSVVDWSICNESHYSTIMEVAHDFARKSDPSRPCSGTFVDQYTHVELIGLHYVLGNNPVQAIKELGKQKKPQFHDETLPVFHGWEESATWLDLDPCMRDYWVTGYPEIIDALIKTDNQVGTMMWAWVDDEFLVPGKGIGYWRPGMQPIRYADTVYKMPGRGIVGDVVWGMIDGWRRPKPEWWLNKKLYSDVQIEEKPLAIPAAGAPVVIKVRNQGFQADLDRLVCKWSMAEENGEARVQAPQQGEGDLKITPAHRVSPDDILVLEFYDETGRMVNGFKLAFKRHEIPSLPSSGKPAEIIEDVWHYQEGESALRLVGQRTELTYDRGSGGLTRGLANNEQVLTSGPSLYIYRSDSSGEQYPLGWNFTGEEHSVKGGNAVLRWNGSYGSDFDGGYQIEMDDAGDVEIDYSFKYNGPDMYVHEIGLDFHVPLEFDKLAWDRRSEYSYYPADHIGRPVGEAVAHPRVAQTVPPGDRPYGLDGSSLGLQRLQEYKAQRLLGQYHQFARAGHQDHIRWHSAHPRNGRRS